MVMMVMPFAAAFSASTEATRAPGSERGITPLRRREQYGDGRRSHNREFAARGEKMAPGFNRGVLGFLF